MSFFWAHRPFPSMIIARWAGRADLSRPSLSKDGGLDFKNFLLFLLEDLVDHFDVIVREFLGGFLSFK